MSYFIDKDSKEISNIEETKNSIDTCVVGITSSNPYDRYVFVNNSTTFYAKITYSELIILYDLIDLATKKTNTTTYDEKESETSTSINMNMLHIINCFKDPSVKIIFRFLCSQDCHDGLKFIDNQTTYKIYDFVKLVTRRNCVIIEVSDHSMGSFFNNWNNEYMGKINPIKILPITHSGSFKMYGGKNDFINSTHPTLKQIGNLSSDEQVEITFNNMGGTKVYKILDPNVKLISKGIQIKEKFKFDLGKTIEIKSLKPLNLMEQLEPFESLEVYDEVPVHCEFDYQEGKIVISATHWCNLDSVESPVDLPTLRRYCTNSLGIDATVDLENTLSLAKNECEYKRIISDTVREISCGITSRPIKKYKQNSNENDEFDI